MINLVLRQTCLGPLFLTVQSLRIATASNGTFFDYIIIIVIIIIIIIIMSSSSSECYVSSLMTCLTSRELSTNQNPGSLHKHRHFSFTIGHNIWPGYTSCNPPIHGSIRADTNCQLYNNQYSLLRHNRASCNDSIVASFCGSITILT